MFVIQMKTEQRKAISTWLVRQLHVQLVEADTLVPCLPLNAKTQSYA